MRSVAEIICAFPDELPCVVVSAMGKTTNLLLEAGRLAITTGTDSVPAMKPLQAIKALHRDTCVGLDVDEDTVASVEKLLSELQQLLIGLSIVQVRLLHTLLRVTICCTTTTSLWCTHRHSLCAPQPAPAATMCYHHASLQWRHMLWRTRSETLS